MIPDRLAEIRARSEAATPGPWHAAVDTGRRLGTALVGHKVDDGTGRCIAVFAEASAHRRADARFVAAAREDVPELLAELAEAREGLAAANPYWRLRSDRHEAERDEALAEVERLSSKLDEYRAELRDARDDLLEVRGILSPNGGASILPQGMNLGQRVAPAIDWLVQQLIAQEPCE